MTESAISELLASYEAALDAAQRSVAVTRTLAEGLLAGQHPPDDVIREYVKQAAHDDERVSELRGRMAVFRELLRTH